MILFKLFLVISPHENVKINKYKQNTHGIKPVSHRACHRVMVEVCYIQQKSPRELTTELRTFALIRLGVKNTADIAGLLFLSPQTIYNCRSVIRNRAINKESFDEDVQKLCTVIK